MKNKKIILLIVILGIAVVGTVTFFIFRPRHQELLPQQFAELPEKPKLIAEFHHGLEIYSVAFSPTDPSLIVSVDENGTIKLWDRNNTKEPVKILSHPEKYVHIGFSPTGELLASVDFGTLILWDVASGTKLNSLETSNRQFPFSLNGHQLATVHDNRKGIHEAEVKIWDIRNPKKITEIATLDEAHRAKVWARAVDISSDGKWIAVGDYGGTVNVWDLQTQQLVKSLETSLHAMDFLKFSPNNNYIVTGGYDQDMYSSHSVQGFIMWELPSWQRKGGVLRGHVENLVFSPDGNTCVSANNWSFYGRGVEIWSTTNGAPITFLRTEARDVSFSQDGKILATGGHDGILRLWELTPQQLELATIQNDVVRLIYRLPKDKEPTPNITEKLDKLIRKVQDFYADEMERHGFGRKTFTFETDKNGKAKIYLLKENQTNNYDLSNDIWLIFVDQVLKSPRSVPTGYDSTNFNETFVYPTKRRIIVKDKIWMSDVEGFIGNKTSVSSTKKGFDWKLTVHELKYTFAALDQKHRKYEPNTYKRFFLRINSIMPWGKGWVKLSKCQAEWLNKSRFFNPNQPFFDKRPDIEMNVLKVDASDSRLFQFTLSDEDGIQQVQIFTPEITKYQSRMSKFEGCRTLNGKKEATVEFEISDPEIKNGEVRMIDMHGNIASREFRITEKIPEPSEKP